MTELLLTSKVIVCVGSGGVGKTTVASALALRGAQLGRRVLVLTVDPSKRLKTTMGLEGEDQATVSHPSITTGQLSAAVIDAKKTFDEFVTKAALSPELSQKILNNKLYIQLSTTLSGSQEFTALQKLYSSYASGKYDLIVLDTPPTKHAIDFLESPQKLSSIFNEKIAKWIRDPGAGGQGFFKGLMQTGTKQVLKGLETLTGAEFMTELTDFFKGIQQWQGQLEKRIADVQTLLVSPTTHFILVTSFDEAKLKEGEFFSKQIRQAGYKLSAVLINRAYPKGLDLHQEIVVSNDLESLYVQYQKYLEAKEKLYQSFSIRMHGAAGESEEVLKIPELLENISDLAGVVEMAQNIDDAEKRKNQ